MKYLALHHTAVEGNFPQLYAVNRYHKEKWNMISSLGWYVGYNYFCEKNGIRTNIRAIGEETIAQKGHNCDIKERCDTISYCWAGDFRVEQPTEKQKEDFKNLVTELREKYPDIKVVGHRDLQTDRSCPCLSAEFIDNFNTKGEEEIKSEKIKELQSIVDLLKILLEKLRSVLSIKYK